MAKGALIVLPLPMYRTMNVTDVLSSLQSLYCVSWGKEGRKEEGEEGRGEGRGKEEEAVGRSLREG